MTVCFNGAAVDERRKAHASYWIGWDGIGFNGAAVDERRKGRTMDIVAGAYLASMGPPSMNGGRPISAAGYKERKGDELQWGRRR